MGLRSGGRMCGRRSRKGETVGRFSALESFVAILVGGQEEGKAQ